MPSLKNIFLSIVNVAKIAAIPNISPMLAILLPIIFPITIFVSLAKTAAIDVASSGREVPIATKLKPIANSDILNAFASIAADSTK